MYLNPAIPKCLILDSGPQWTGECGPGPLGSANHLRGNPEPVRPRPVNQAAPQPGQRVLARVRSTKG